MVNIKKCLIIVLLAALAFAFVGCKDDVPEEKPPVELPEGFEEFVLDLPESTSATGTGEIGSKMFKFTGDSFTKIKEAKPGSYLSVTYKADVSYAVGEIGYIDATTAGPVISGDGKNKNVTANIDIVHLTEVIGTDGFTIHIFNGAKLIEVNLVSAAEGYTPAANAKATAGARKIFIPFGNPVTAKGDLSKTDFKAINAAESGKVVFYYNDTASTDNGLLKFGPKCGSPYKHYGVSVDGAIVDGDAGWRIINNAEKMAVEYTVAELKAAVTAAGEIYNKFEINPGDDTKKGEILYIELITP